MNTETDCVPQVTNGVCNVFNCPWSEYNTEEEGKTYNNGNSIEVSFLTKTIEINKVIMKVENGF